MQVSSNGQFRYANSKWFASALERLKVSGVHGMAIDVWVSPLLIHSHSIAFLERSLVHTQSFTLPPQVVLQSMGSGLTLAQGLDDEPVLCFCIWLSDDGNHLTGAALAGC